MFLCLYLYMLASVIYFNFETRQRARVRGLPVVSRLEAAGVRRWNDVTTA